ncbi:MAG: hypothetical protein ACKOWO_05585 [Sediminibacterium sp.]
MEMEAEKENERPIKTGWVKFFRSLTEWEWWDDHNTFRTFSYLLLSVNHEDKKWRGIEIKAGQMITGRKTLAASIGLSEQQIRTCLDKLKSTKEITIENFGFSSLISIVNWEKYQEATKETTKHQPSDNQVSTKYQPPLKNDKNIKNINICSFDIESVYQQFPRKLGKAGGIKKLSKEIKTQEQFENLKKAVANYSSSVSAKKTSIEYVKYFSTFASEWEAWVDIPQEEFSPKQNFAKKNNSNAVIDHYNSLMSELGSEVMT